MKVAVHRSKMLMILCLLAFCSTNSTAYAGDLTDGRVIELVPSIGNFTIRVTGARSNVPVCASSQSDYWFVDPSTANGQAMIASLLTAFGSGKRIFISGTGSCHASANIREQIALVAVYE